MEPALSLDTLILSPSNRAKLKSRNAALKIKNGSPKLKEVLRLRCRERLREKRGNIFDSSRAINEPVLAEIFHQELNNIYEQFEHDSGFTSQTSLNEMPVDGEMNSNEMGCSQEEEWIMNQYEQMTAAEDEFISELLEEQVVCPLCLKGVLVETDRHKIATCTKCHDHIPAPGGLTTLDKRLRAEIVVHAENCASIPSFTKICDGTNNLYILCLDCSYFSTIY